MLKTIVILLIVVFIAAIIHLNNIRNHAIGIVFKDELIPIIKYPKLAQTRVDEPYFKTKSLIEVYSRSNYEVKALSNFDIRIVGIQNVVFEIANDQNTRNIEFQIKVNELEKEEVEVIIEKPVYIESPTIKLEDVMISGVKDLEIPVNTAFDEFLEIISKDISSNTNVMIDYTQVNLLAMGNYPLSYHFNDETITVNVLIY